MIQRFFILWVVLLVTLVARCQTVTIPANSMTFSTVATVTTVGPTLTDSAGNKWSINASGQVVIGSQALTATSNVVQIALVNGSLWQLNKAGSWYEATAVTGTAPNQTVTWSNGTTISPLASGNTFTGPVTPLTLTVTGSSGFPAGMTWTPSTSTAPAILSVPELRLTSGPALPICPSLVYVYQLNQATEVLSLICLPLTITP